MINSIKENYFVQEQQDGSEQEKNDLVKELSQSKQQNESLRSSLREQQQELDSVKVRLRSPVHSSCV